MEIMQHLEYLDENKDEPNVLCVECKTTVDNGILNPVKMKKTSENNIFNKNINYFQRKHEDLIRKENVISE